MCDSDEEYEHRKKIRKEAEAPVVKRHNARKEKFHQLFCSKN